MNVDQLRTGSQARRRISDALEDLAVALQDQLSDDWSARIDWTEEGYAADPSEVGAIVSFIEVDIAPPDKNWAWTVVVEVHHHLKGSWLTTYRVFNDSDNADENLVFYNAVDVVKAAIEWRQEETP